MFIYCLNTCAELDQAHCAFSMSLSKSVTCCFSQLQNIVFCHRFNIDDQKEKLLRSVNAHIHSNNFRQVENISVISIANSLFYLRICGKTILTL